MAVKQDLEIAVVELKKSISSDLDVKIAEIVLKTEEGNISKNVFRNPIIIAIFSSIIGAFGLMLGKIQDSRIQASQQKDKFESDLIIESVKTDKNKNEIDTKTKLENLEFLVRAGLITEHKENIEKLIAEAKKDTTAADSLLKYYPAPSKNTLIAGNPDAASQWENRGFDALLNKDVNTAINAFNNAEQSYNGYHMVYDIWNYLRTNNASLSSSDETVWKNVYSELLKRFSWGMQPDRKRQFSDLAK